MKGEEYLQVHQLEDYLYEGNCPRCKSIKVDRQEVLGNLNSWCISRGCKCMKCYLQWNEEFELCKVHIIK